MLRFQPTEVPHWDVNVPTSQKLAEISAWCEQYSRLSADAKLFVERSYCRAAAAKFVLNTNLSENTGLADLDSTQEVLAAAGAVASRPAKETKQLGAAMQLLADMFEQLSAAQTEHSLEALTLTPDMICQVHRTLMKGLSPNAGEYRNGEAYGGFATGVFFYQPSELIPSLLLTVCDFYNQSLRAIAASTDQVSELYRLAAVLFVQFVTVHPFSDGNGRLARLLASHVLRAVTPFPVTTHADGTVLTRTVFLNAIMASRPANSNTFLSLSAPTDFAALLMQSGWEGWRCCFDNLKRMGFDGAHTLRGVLCAQTYNLKAYQQLHDVGLSAQEREEEYSTLSKFASAMQTSGQDRCEVRLAKDTVCVLYNFETGLKC